MRSGAIVLVCTVAIGALVGGPERVRAGDRRDDLHSAADVTRLARENGLSPFGEPRRRRGVYEVDGVDEGGEPTHVLIDAVTGDLLWRTHRGVTLPRSLPAERPADRMEPGDVRTAHRPIQRLKAASAARPREDRPSTSARPAHRPLTPARTRTVSGGAATPLHTTAAIQPRPILIRDPLALPDSPTTAQRSTDGARRTFGAPAETTLNTTQRAIVPVAPLE